MLLEDYPRYQRVIDGESKYKPNELKHVFDTSTGRYTTNEFNCCYYSPANITGLKFTSNNTDIVSVSGEELIAENIGNCKISGTKNNEEILSFKVIVYRDKKPNRKFKNTLLLPLNNMININTVLKHIHCPHYTDCIFERDIFKIYADAELFDVVHEINQTIQQIKDYQDIKVEYRNGNIIYHPALDELYNIQIIKENRDDEIKHHVKTSVVDDFHDRIDSQIKNLRQHLNDLKHRRRRLEV